MHVWHPCVRIHTKLVMMQTPTSEAGLIDISTQPSHYNAWPNLNWCGYYCIIINKLTFCSAPPPPSPLHTLSLNFIPDNLTYPCALLLFTISINPHWSILLLCSELLHPLHAVTSPLLSNTIFLWSPLFIVRLQRSAIEGSGMCEVSSVHSNVDLTHDRISHPEH